MASWLATPRLFARDTTVGRVSTVSSLPSCNLIQAQTGAEVNLIVTHEHSYLFLPAKLFTACPYTMSHYSEVWHDKLFRAPPSLVPIFESQQSEAVALHLEVKDLNHIPLLTMVLRMIYGDFDGVPTTFHAGDLLELAGIVKRFGLNCSFGRWQEQWFSPVRERLVSSWMRLRL